MALLFKELTVKLLDVTLIGSVDVKYSLDLDLSLSLNAMFSYDNAKITFYSAKPE